jgi:hypothetical protein
VADDGLFGLDERFLPGSLQEAVEHGEVFRRRWVVETILDLVGYRPERDLTRMLLVEPAYGAEAFLGSLRG